MGQKALDLQGLWGIEFETLNRLFTDSHWSEFLKFLNLGEGELSYKDILCYFTLSVVKLYYNIF